jgi:septal ring factor EnvC (AmiA/AmiB activator)
MSHRGIETYHCFISSSNVRLSLSILLFNAFFWRLLYLPPCSEHDRRERDLRKNIQDLSRGVHSSDKTYVALRNELDQAQSKIKALETKKADVSC